MVVACHAVLTGMGKLNYFEQQQVSFEKRVEEIIGGKKKKITETGK